MAKIILMLAAEFLILMMIIDGSGKKSGTFHLLLISIRNQLYSLLSESNQL